MKTKAFLTTTTCLLLMLLFSCPGIAQNGNPQTAERYPLIPLPANLQPAEGEFIMNANTLIWVHEEAKSARELTDYLRELISRSLGGQKVKLKTGSDSPSESNVIQILIDGSNAIPREGYELEVNSRQIILRASSAQGAFWGMQTLRQLMPPAVENSGLDQIPVPCVKVTDSPRFPYRGLHLDVVRHLFPVEFIKRYIDLMSLYKLNTFHWHLTDDQGWRIEIKEYPKLQTVAAFRNETLIGHYTDQPKRFDGKRYGGYYTQKEVREVVEYARLRHVTVIPEIEMPGHALAALSAYPQLGCTGGPYTAATEWGVFDDIFCAGNEETFRFLENVLSEVMTLFPGKYIHIGGDEAPKTRWETCPKCQARMRAEGLSDEHELQSYFVQRMEKFVNAQGRQIIGWDEILEGGLAPNATVMSWRGADGGIEAARQGHDVIMTPNAHLYLDHYQAQGPDEPVAIGGFTPVKEVYEYDPVPGALNGPAAEHVLGAQGNLWTEYIHTSDHVEYMAYPRALALAEVVWSPVGARDYEQFLDRLQVNLEHLSALGVNYAGHVFDVQGAARVADSRLLVSLETEDKHALIRYTLDGSDPTAASPEYKRPFPVDSRVTVKAIRFKNGQPVGNVFEQAYIAHRAIGKKVTLSQPPSEKYGAGGAQALTDGLPGSARTANNWLGWEGGDLEAVVDLGQAQLVESVSLNYSHAPSQWIHAPSKVEVLFSYDGSAFTPFYEAATTPSEDGILEIRIPVGEENIRYIKVIAHNVGTIPAGDAGAGHKAWLFADELIVE